MARSRRWLNQPLSWRRGGAVALAVLGVLIAAALMLDAGGSAELERIEVLLQEQGRPPVELVEAAGRGAQLVIVSDIAGHGGPKRLVAEAVRALAEGPGLDAVVLSVPADEQPYIDTYLNRSEEDATILLARPAAVPDRGGTGPAFLEIYRTVWQVNQEVGPARRIRIIAADHSDWPPGEGASPQDVAGIYAARSEHILGRMDMELFALTPDARALILVDGYLALQRSHGRLQFAGGADRRVDWLGELLRERAPGAVRTILLDAAASPTAVRRLPEYHGTEIHRAVRRGIDRSVGVRIDETFSVVRDPILESAAPGLRLQIRPAGYVLRDVADGYIFLRGGR
jgi:hypothetical protein